jgi:maleylpyruvate isomerase
VRALAQSIACEIHPVNNLRVLKYVVGGIEDAGEAAAARTAWFQRWAREGLQAFERQLEFGALQRAADGLLPSTFCYGSTPTLADLCLVPQVFNNRRFEVSLSGLPRTQAAFDACMQLPAFQAAQPSACPDFEA